MQKKINVIFFFNGLRGYKIYKHIKKNKIVNNIKVFLAEKNCTTVSHEIAHELLRQLNHKKFIDVVHDIWTKHLFSDLYFEQYGIFGTLLLTLIYFLYPIILLMKKHNYILYIPIIFYLSTFHYPPQISKIMMIFVGLSLWFIYLKPDTNKYNSNDEVPLS